MKSQKAQKVSSFEGRKKILRRNPPWQDEGQFGRSDHPLVGMGKKVSQAYFWIKIIRQNHDIIVTTRGLLLVTLKIYLQFQ